MAASEPLALHEVVQPLIWNSSVSDVRDALRLAADHVGDICGVGACSDPSPPQDHPLPAPLVDAIRNWALAALYRRTGESVVLEVNELRARLFDLCHQPEGPADDRVAYNARAAAVASGSVLGSNMKSDGRI